MYIHSFYLNLLKLFCLKLKVDLYKNDFKVKIKLLQL